MTNTVFMVRYPCQSSDLLNIKDSITAIRDLTISTFPSSLESLRTSLRIYLGDTSYEHLVYTPIKLNVLHALEEFRVAIHKLTQNQEIDLQDMMAVGNLL